jgi:hypothetical protein
MTTSTGTVQADRLDTGLYGSMMGKKVCKSTVVFFLNTRESTHNVYNNG